MKNYELKMDRYQEEGKEKYLDNYIFEAENHIMNNYDEVMKSSKATCMYCGYSFNPNEFSATIECIPDRDGNKTIHCPNCYCDAILGDKSGYPVTDIYFIARCTRLWFNGYSRLDYIGFSNERIKWVKIEVD